ncbi:L-rhamnose isomerase/sugar isomerase [Rhizomicrobium palustre]|uniref:L-rhamnose isomerase/sugar isomerase n=1 Tax=Rhizomicrobium palustre TaxID=189966 RepID=A0A846N0Y3_9PROT|nr:sugar isomerase [Rhizomicrobium palustre]NIK89149.1 L-rhamnose isomerase/sugar isomerase [Rhizomicrobium palustre]
MTIKRPLNEEIIATHNAKHSAAIDADYAALAAKLARVGINIDAVKAKVASFAVAIPSWGTATGGTRFGRFPIPGEPTNVQERLTDCAVVQQLCRVTPGVSTHFPWDNTSDPAAMREEAESLGLYFDAVNSNTFQDQPGQAETYKFGSLSAAAKASREQAIAHNIDCIEIGKKLGSKALTVWVGDGTNFPGQQSFRDSFDRYLDSSAAIYAALPSDWLMLIEHKFFEPAFYSTVIADWGVNLMAANALGAKARCLVDLGHHAPNVNVEQIVSMLDRVGKLGGFHFNDSKYGDDDLDAGAINPHRLFLIFNELVEAELRAPKEFAPAYMIDESHNLTDPAESLLSAAEAIVCAYARALLVDRVALKAHRESNDVLMAFKTLRAAYNIDVSPLVAKARVDAGGAADPVAALRESGWRKAKAAERKSEVNKAAGII